MMQVYMYIGFGYRIYLKKNLDVMFVFLKIGGWEPTCCPLRGFETLQHCIVQLSRSHTGRQEAHLALDQSSWIWFSVWVERERPSVIRDG